MDRGDHNAGNLGRYQDIVTEAKRAGGVDAWIKILEDAAVADRSTKSFAKGVGLGLLVAAGMAGTAQALWVQNRDRRALIDKARAQLKAGFEGVPMPDAMDDEIGSEEDDSGSEQHP